MARSCLGKGDEADKMVVRKASELVLGAKAGREEGEVMELREDEY